MTQLNTPHRPPIGGTRLVVAALALAVAAVVLNSLYIASVQRGAALDSFNVYVVTRSMLPGDRLKRQDVRAHSIPKRFKESFSRLGAIDDGVLEANLSVSEAIKQSIAEGEILRAHHFESPTGQAAISVTSGFRLVALPVNSRTMPGALKPGMFVDVEAPFQTGGSMPQVIPVMENVRVIAMGTRSMYEETDPSRPRPMSSYQSITIEVMPEDATNLAMIERMMAGEFEVSIRNPGDTKLVKFVRESGKSDINPAVLDMIRTRLGQPPAAKRQ